MYEWTPPTDSGHENKFHAKWSASFQIPFLFPTQQCKHSHQVAGRSIRYFKIPTPKANILPVHTSMLWAAVWLWRSYCPCHSLHLLSIKNNRSFKIIENISQVFCEYSLSYMKTIYNSARKEVAYDSSSSWLCRWSLKIKNKYPAWRSWVWQVNNSHHGLTCFYIHHLVFYILSLTHTKC